MKSNPLAYHLFSDTELVLTDRAFAEIQTLIPYAAITRFNGLVLLQSICHEANSHTTAVFYNGESVNGFSRCTSCKNRLRKFNGSCNYAYEPLNSLEPFEFSVLVNHLQQLQAKEETHMMSYCQSFLSYDSRHTESVQDTPYEEYRSLIRFFERMSDAISLVHQIRFSLKRRFR